MKELMKKSKRVEAMDIEESDVGIGEMFWEKWAIEEKIEKLFPEWKFNLLNWIGNVLERPDLIFVC